MGMTHVTSGRVGYVDYSDLSLLRDSYQVEMTAPRELILQMLIRENELRLAPQTQANYKRRMQEYGFSGFVMVTEDLQKQVAREFHLKEEEGIKILRCAPYLVTSPQDQEEIKNISLYRKYNRINDGILSKGDSAPNVTLFQTTGEIIPNGLFSFKSTSKPLILIAGSIT